MAVFNLGLATSKSRLLIFKRDLEIARPHFQIAKPLISGYQIKQYPSIGSNQKPNLLLPDY